MRREQFVEPVGGAITTVEPLDETFMLGDRICQVVGIRFISSAQASLDTLGAGLFPVGNAIFESETRRYGSASSVVTTLPPLANGVSIKTLPDWVVAIRRVLEATPEALTRNAR